MFCSVILQTFYIAIYPGILICELLFLITWQCFCSSVFKFVQNNPLVYFQNVRYIFCRKDHKKYLEQKQVEISNTQLICQYNLSDYLFPLIIKETFRLKAEMKSAGEVEKESGLLAKLPPPSLGITSRTVAMPLKAFLTLNCRKCSTQVTYDTQCQARSQGGEGLRVASPSKFSLPINKKHYHCFVPFQYILPPKNTSLETVTPKPLPPV